MNVNRRAASNATIAILAVAVIGLASSTAYLGYLALSSGSGTGTGNSIPVTVISGGSSNSGQVAGIDPPADSITVTGTGSVTFVPNEALVYVTVTTTNRTAETAAQSNAKSTSGVIKALNGIGISNSSLRTQGYSIYPNYNNYGGSAPSIVSYTVSNSILANLTSGNAAQLGLQAGKAIDTAVHAGANQINLQFAASSTLAAEVNTKALQQAVASASVQAKTIAAALGVKILGVISATEGYSYYPQAYQNYGSAVVEVPPGNYSLTPVIPGTQSASASVVVVYSIS